MLALTPVRGTTSAYAHVQLALGLRSLIPMEGEADLQRRFAYAVSAAMAAKGWKPPDLAKALGMHPTAVGRWVKGETLPNILTVKPLAKALSVRPEFLYDPPPIPDYPLSEYLVREASATGTEEGIAAARPRRRRAGGVSSES